MARTISFLLAVALAAAPTLAQDAEGPLGNILDAIEEAPPSVAAPATAAPAVPRGRIGTVDLPPSSVPAPAQLPVEEVEEATAARPEDARWAEMRESRRAEVDAVEAPITAALNAEAAARVEARRRAAEQAEAEHRRAAAEHQAQVERAEREYREEQERYRRQVARERADHEARVRACLDGIREACARPDELFGRR